jgi:hypothetical protein
VDAEGTAQPLRVDRGIEQGEVGGMEDRIAKSAEHRDRREARERGHDRERAHHDAERQETAGQDRPRAESVDGEADRGLAEP